MPFILILDGHTSHDNYELYKWCKPNYIEVVKLLPNATRILQPADVAVFGAAKARWKTLSNQWKIEHPAEDFREGDFIRLLKNLMDYIRDKKTTIVNGFRVTGLCPLDETNTLKDRCLGVSAAVAVQNITIAGKNFSKVFKCMQC